MKKIKMLLITIAMLLPSLASADVPAWEWGPKYMGEMHIGYGTSRKQNGYKAYCGRAMLGTLQGVQLSNYLSAAVGVDAVMFTHYYKGQDMRLRHFSVNLARASDTASSTSVAVCNNTTQALPA